MLGPNNEAEADEAFADILNKLVKIQNRMQHELSESTSCLLPSALHCMQFEFLCILT